MIPTKGGQAAVIVGRPPLGQSGARLTRVRGRMLAPTPIEEQP